MAIDPTLEQDFARMLNRIISSIPPVAIPSVVYHYTSVAGMIAILDSKSLWATEARYLNDSTEMTYAADEVIAPLVERRVANEPHDRRTYEVLEGIKGIAGLVKESGHRYVTCFCERDDLLNQWRVYAGNDGYSIGFDTSRLLGSGVDAQLRNVVYTSAQQHGLVSQILQSTAEFLDPHFRSERLSDNDKEYLLARCLVHTTKAVTGLVLNFKHPSFDVEHEWRLIAMSKPGRAEKPRHRAGRYGLTPYLKLEPRDASGNLLPIVSLTHGPTSLPSNAKHAMRSLLLEHGYDLKAVAIKGSSVPIRV
jgi:hypothetical protein